MTDRRERILYPYPAISLQKAARFPLPLKSGPATEYPVLVVASEVDECQFPDSFQTEKLPRHANDESPRPRTVIHGREVLRGALTRDDRSAPVDPRDRAIRRAHADLHRLVGPVGRKDEGEPPLAPVGETDSLYSVARVADLEKRAIVGIAHRY
jgi:hypothetical protein